MSREDFINPLCSRCGAYIDEPDVEEGELCCDCETDDYHAQERIRQHAQP